MITAPHSITGSCAEITSPHRAPERPEAWTPVQMMLATGSGIAGIAGIILVAESAHRAGAVEAYITGCWLLGGSAQLLAAIALAELCRRARCLGYRHAGLQTGVRANHELLTQLLEQVQHLDGKLTRGLADWDASQDAAEIACAQFRGVLDDIRYTGADAADALRGAFDLAGGGLVDEFSRRRGSSS